MVSARSRNGSRLASPSCSAKRRQWMPSGTMVADRAAGSICERRGNRRIAFHPQCHLDVHEKRVTRTCTGCTRTCSIARAAADARGPRGRPRAARRTWVLEPPASKSAATAGVGRADGVLAPRRTTKGSHSTWTARGLAVRPVLPAHLAEIADLFDTVYGPALQGPGAPAGAALTGTKVVIDEARVWQIRHGGRLFTAYPFLIAAERGLDEVLPRMPEPVARARTSSRRRSAPSKGLISSPTRPRLRCSTSSCTASSNV